MAAAANKALIAAATTADKAAVKKALDGGANIQAIGQNGNSALHCAVAKETAANVAVVKMLIEGGADATAENDFGDTPLSVATSKKHAKLIPMLEEAAAEQEAKEAAERKAKAEAKKKKAEGSGDGGGAGSSLPYRRTGNVGWKPLSKDWMEIVRRRKPLTDDLTGRKVALSFSNKSTDAAFAKELSALLAAAGCTSRMITKWPVNGWVQACVFAADEADFVVVLHSANYDEGHYSIAERFLVCRACRARCRS